MRVAMFTDSYLPRINGVSVSIKSFAIELTKKGHEVFIICPCYEEKDHSYIEKMYLSDSADTVNNETNNKSEKYIELYRVSSHIFILSKEDRLSKITEWHSLKKYLDNIKPDVIHANTEYVNGRFAYYYAKHRHLPLVYTFHTYWENYFKNYAEIVPSEITRFFGRQVSMYFLKRADTIIAPTERFADVVRSYGIESHMTVLPTGISDQFDSFDHEKEIAVTKQIESIYPDYKNKKILLYVGRIAKEKNLDFLVEVFDQVKKHYEDAILVFVGDGPEFKALKHTASKSKYEKDILFTGYFERDNLPYIYKMSHIFVFPSMTETQGLVTIEAMTIGIPVVAIGEMGTYDVMQGDNGGFMVKNDVEEFSQRTLELLKDEELHHRKSVEAIEWSKKWSIGSTTDRLIEIYNDVIKNHK